MSQNPSRMLGPGMRDTTPDGEPKCDNCSQAAVWLWTLDSDQLAQSCDGCRPANGVTRRALDAPATSSERPPLTVEQAAARENRSTRTIYRWIADGLLGDGAWQDKPGSTWRIDPDALDARRSAPPRPTKSAPRKRRPRASAPSKAADWFDA